MRMLDRARTVALALLAAAAGSAAVGIAALAHAGLCLHRMGLFGLSHTPPAAAAMHGMSGMAMPGMTGMTMAMPAPMAMSPDAMAAGAPCPVLLGASVAAALLYAVAVAAILVTRPSASAVALSSARLILRLRFAPLATLLAAVAAVPVGATVIIDGTPGVAIAVLGGLVVIGAAALGASALLGAARIVLAFARRLVVAIVQALQLLVPGGDGPRALRPAATPLPAGVRLVRRRPSRAPPAAVLAGPL